MADEIIPTPITVVQTLSWARGGDSIRGSASEKYTQNLGLAMLNIQTIGITSETLALGDTTAVVGGEMTDVGYLLVKNEDTKNTIYVSKDSPAAASTAQYKLAPNGGSAIIRPGSQQILYYAIADTAPSNLLVFAIQR